MSLCVCVFFKTFTECILTPFKTDDISGLGSCCESCFLLIWSPVIKPGAHLNTMFCFFRVGHVTNAPPPYPNPRRSAGLRDRPEAPLALLAGPGRPLRPVNGCRSPVIKAGERSGVTPARVSAADNKERLRQLPGLESLRPKLLTR